MREIRLLDPIVANQIAAGEVVTRPSAVVKELLENAVDASARNITLSLSQAGEAVICVIDDGCGIPSEQIPLAFARHATSKISSSADIFKINTLGFRGEALASISSVSEVEMKTRTTDSETGLKVLVREGNIISKEEVAMPCGTSISVYNLFYNTPARRKFLKSDVYEKRLCIDEFEHVALSHPDISFTLKLDGQQPIFYPICTLSDRVKMIAKKKIVENLVHVFLETDILKIEGWVAAPQNQVQGTKDMYFFVNGRYMNPRLLCRAVTAAYGKMLPEGKMVPCYLFLEVEPGSIDVNVHPTKAEIKFDNEKEIWDLIRSSVRKAVGTSYDVPVLDFDKKVNIDIPTYTKFAQLAPSVPRSSGSSLRNYNPFDINYEEGNNVSVDSEAEKLPFTENLPEGIYIPKFDDDEYEIVSSSLDVKRKIELSEIIRLEGKYFAVRNETSLLIINYARAQERIEYENFLKKEDVSESHVCSQRLLFPETLTLSVYDASLLIQNSQYLSKLGFEIGDLGAGVVALYSVPSSFATIESYDKVIEDIIKGLIDEIPTEYSKYERMAATVARTYANRRSIPNDTELKVIADSLLKCDEPKLTPISQQPIMWTITTSDIDKIFKR